ncbi:MAG: hypothetical protein KDA42_13060 [Planctomycetales bacterium]|nr:hypothetical protein [Planctomycetales bacterium]
MSGKVPPSIERWLGIQSSNGEGTLWTLDNSWSFPPWMTLLFCLFAVAWVWYFYAREPESAGRRAKATMGLMRVAVIGLVLFMIAEYLISLKRTGLPYVAVIVDESASMGIAHRLREPKLQQELSARLTQAGLDELSRLNLAKLLLVENDAKLLSTIARRYKLKVYFLSGAAKAQSGDVDQLVDAIRLASAAGEVSRLGDGVREVLADLRGTPPAAVVMLTDGITTEGSSLDQAAAYARRKGVPLFTVGLGSEEPILDVELADLLVDEVVFVDDIVTFQATVRASGLAGRQATVLLRDKQSNRVLTKASVTLPEQGDSADVRLPYRPREVGQFEFVVEVQPQQHEIQTSNNLASRTVSVRKEKVRVLLVQAYPNHEFRYLKNMLARDTTIELSTVLQESDLEYAQVDQSALRVFPVRREELFRYDVVLLGDVDPSFLSRLATENLRAFVVERGGGIVMMAGPRHLPWDFRDTPLESLFPIELDDLRRPGSDENYTEPFVLKPTSLGMASAPFQLGDSPRETASLWQGLPPLYWFQDASHVKPTARVLAVHPSRTLASGAPLPLIALQYVGAGKVLYHGFDETWRWRFRVGDSLFARYWIQSIRYLARAKLLGGEQRAELTVDRREYRRGEPVRLRVRFLDDRTAPASDQGVTVVIDQRGQRSRRVTLERSSAGRGIFEGVFTEATEGDFEVWMATPSVEGRPPSTSFLVSAPPGEFQQTAMDVDQLTRAASATHGKYYTIRNVDRLIDELPQGRQVPVETLPPAVLWNRWWILFLLLGLLVGEWLLRKKHGLA